MALFSPARGHSLLWHMQTFPFEFPNQEKLHESYNGINVRLRYFIKFSIARQYSSNIGTQYIFLSYSDWFDLEMQWKSKIFGCKRSHRTQTSTTRSRWKSALKIAYISNLSTTRPSMALWNCEIVLFSVWAVSFGLENVSHSRPFVHFANAICARYHLKDVVVGKIYFLLVRIKIKHMELAIIRRESTGSGHLCSSQPRVCVTREYRPQPIQRKWNDHEVRNHGWGASPGRIDSNSFIPQWFWFVTHIQGTAASATQVPFWVHSHRLYTTNFQSSTIWIWYWLMKKTDDTSSSRRYALYFPLLSIILLISVCFSGFDLVHSGSSLAQGAIEVDEVIKPRVCLKWPNFIKQS